MINMNFGSIIFDSERSFFFIINILNNAGKEKLVSSSSLELKSLFSLLKEKLFVVWWRDEFKDLLFILMLNFIFSDLYEVYSNLLFIMSEIKFDSLLVILSLKKILLL